MYRNEREHEILKLLSAEGYLSVSQLSKTLYTSESSIRRDLTALEKQGLVTRSYGGAELTKNSSQIVPFSDRAHHNVSAKKIMARKAGHLVKDGSIVFLDQSSSSFFVAYELLKKKDITVVSNNLEIITLLSQYNIEVICSGGHISPGNRSCLTGSDAQHIFSQMHADLLFFSSKSLNFDGRIYDCSREEVCVRNAMLQNAEKKVFLCDLEKFGRYSGFQQCSLSDVDFLITENDTDGRIDQIAGAREILLP